MTSGNRDSTNDLETRPCTLKTLKMELKDENANFFLDNRFLRNFFVPKSKFDLYFDKRCVNFIENFWWDIWGHLFFLNVTEKNLQILPYLIETSST